MVTGASRLNGIGAAVCRKLAQGITVNTVNPGPTDTCWMDQQTKRELKNEFPFKRIGLPEDAANLISFLVSKKAA
ncbi:MAG TPA: SDR family oxidoreductase [Halanaerobiales bacterium]|nr:SDR family oxidoreductase [Halanaerobiales bacterium]